MQRGGGAPECHTGVHGPTGARAPGRACRPVFAGAALASVLIALAAGPCAAQTPATTPAATPATKTPAAAPSDAPAGASVTAPARDPGAAPVDAYGELADPALQSRFERITHDLRCLVCQNESIADSNVELAADLRRQVREMLTAGRSDDAIFEFMTDRYGEFVRFNPPLEPKTLLIWGAPFIALAIGVVVVARIVRRRSRMPLDDDAAEERGA
jgi:cytochrome c-type biogenesis protein CcmH